MKLQIDNLDGTGPHDYTAAIDVTRLPKLVRKLNQPAELRFSLVANTPDFVVPTDGARVLLGRTNGQDVFTGYVIGSPAYEYLGWGEQGPVYRYSLLAKGDEAWLDEKRLPDLCPFVDRSAGAALRQLTQDLVGTAIDTSGVQALDLLAGFIPNAQQNWSQHAAEIALQARASYRVINGALVFTPLGQNAYALSDSDPNFSPENLKLAPLSAITNDVTVMGEMAPEAYVTDYFVGDGLTTKFYLSQNPFTKTSVTLVDEEYTEAALDPSLWTVNDPTNAVSVSGGKLRISGGTGVDGATTVQSVEQAELGGAKVMQHGDVMFNAPSSAVIGGLYPGSVSIAGCLAGFRITPSGGQSCIQALINGAAAGPTMTTVSGHHYIFTTRIYSPEIFRRQQVFHSSVHAAGSGIGGALVAANVRLVLEVHEIDPLNPATEVAPSTVLWDNVISNAPGYCSYAVINAANLQCSIAFTQIIQAVDAEVRSALPGQSFTTCLVGDLRDGAECLVTSSAALEFYSAYVPAANQQIEVHYRGVSRSLARITNPASIAVEKRGLDDGVHGAVRRVKGPLARTDIDCENAALAILEDSAALSCAGEYQTWSDFLPGAAADIFPGDALNVSASGANFSALVTDVEIDLRDLYGEHNLYTMKFAQSSDLATSFAFDGSVGPAIVWLDVTQFTNAQVGNVYLADLTAAAVTQVTSTTISVDAGISPPSGGGIEVRWSDAGWGPDNDRNLVGRFATQTFTIPRLSRSQTCYLQQYDGSIPPRYSRYTAALHVDYPL
jgi:hypothetical protein